MKPFKIIYNIFFCLILFIALILIISVLPITNNFKILTVLSGSMEPAIHTGSVVVVKPVSDYKVGDIITFGKISKTQTPTTHRIYEIKESNGQKVFITKGDANNGPDMQEIKQAEIIGKEMFSVSYVGYAVNTAKTPYGFMAIIIIPAIIIIYDEFRKIKDEVKKMRKKKDKIDKKQSEEIKELKEEIMEVEEKK